MCLYDKNYPPPPPGIGIWATAVVPVGREMKEEGKVGK
jgi:hypothetical protein